MATPFIRQRKKVKIINVSKALFNYSVEIKEIFDEVTLYKLDTNFWTSTTQTSYLSFILRFITNKWQRKMILLLES